MSLDQMSSPDYLLKKIQERRKREKKAKELETLTEPEIEWPPKRQHHTRPPSPRTKYVLIRNLSIALLNCAHDCRLSQRQMALIEMGMIQTAEDLPAFAQSLYGCSFAPRVSFAR